ncbi:MAG: hypothetical protein GXO12_01925 [Epsilonproteobacteria bacterium]|nr:hypothetical protein [Campylobacterota bacterium]
MKKNNNKTFWPYGITIAIIAVVIMGAGTIMIALQHPVQMDEAYMKKYQNVDNHYNEIQKSQEIFDSKYKVSINNDAFKIGKNTLLVSVLDKSSNQSVENLNLKVKITRPDDDRFDIKLASSDTKEGHYIFPKFSINKRGRWIVLLSISDGKVEGFFKKEIDVN